MAYSTADILFLTALSVGVCLIALPLAFRILADHRRQHGRLQSRVYGC